MEASLFIVVFLFLRSQGDVAESVEIKLLLILRCFYVNSHRHTNVRMLLLKALFCQLDKGCAVNTRYKQI